MDVLFGKIYRLTGQASLKDATAQLLQQKAAEKKIPVEVVSIPLVIEGQDSIETHIFTGSDVSLGQQLKQWIQDYRRFKEDAEVHAAQMNRKFEAAVARLNAGVRSQLTPEAVEATESPDWEESSLLPEEYKRIRRSLGDLVARDMDDFYAEKDTAGPRLRKWIETFDDKMISNVNGRSYASVKAEWVKRLLEKDQFDIEKGEKPRMLWLKRLFRR